jgi:hypothetical protein
MTTATVEQTKPDTTPEKSAPAETLAPAFSFEENALAFYGDKGAAQQAKADTPTTTETPTAQSEPGPSTTPTASVDSTETAKPGDQPKGTAETKTHEKPGAQEAKADEEKGHAAAARRLGNEVKELKAQFEAVLEENKILKAKLDGTYQEPKKPTEEEIRALENFRGREAASRAVAVQLFGEERVQQEVYDKDSSYSKLMKDKPWLHLRVIKHDQPAVEAMRVLEADRFEQKWGSDPFQWEKKIEDALRPKLLKELKEQAEKPMTGQPAPSVTEARSTTLGERTKTLSNEDVFYGVRKS